MDIDKAVPGREANAKPPNTGRLTICATQHTTSWWPLDLCPATLTVGRPVGQVMYRAKRLVEHAKAHQLPYQKDTLMKDGLNLLTRLEPADIEWPRL